MYIDLLKAITSEYATNPETTQYKLEFLVTLLGSIPSYHHNMVVKAAFGMKEAEDA